MMNGLAAFLLLFIQALVAGTPSAPGVYYRKSAAAWQAVPSARIMESRTKGLSVYVASDGYTNLDQYIAYSRAKASLRIHEPNPTFFIREAGTPADLTVVRLEQKKDRRICRFSPPVATVDNKLGVRKSDMIMLNITTYPDNSFSATPEEALQPGEYLLIFSKATSGYDFGIE